MYRRPPSRSFASLAACLAMASYPAAGGGQGGSGGWGVGEGEGATRARQMISSIRSGSLPLLRRSLESDPAAADALARGIDDPLVAAVESGSLEMVQFLIVWGLQPNRNLPPGRKGTPLDVAVRMGEYPIAELLIRSGAEVNANAPGSDPALFRAAADDNVLGMKFLAEHGANVRLFDWAGDTALHHAASAGSIEAAGYLLDQGLDVDQPGRQRMTALFQAARLGRAEMVRYLLSRGATPLTSSSTPH